MTFDDDPMAESARSAAAFSAELGRMRESLGATSRDLGALEKGFAGGLRRAIDGLVLDGDRLSDALSTVGRSMMDTVYKAAMKPVTDRLGGLIAGMMPFANGGVMAGGRVTPFAKGGVVAGATAFPMRGGTGLMGEAGPEAIMPLARGPDGKLGVRGGGGGGAQVTINVTTPDAASFARSQSQIAAEMSRLLGRGARNR
jgi:phage-related minor tail protein